jgi:hypothetical protein
MNSGATGSAALTVEELRALAARNRHTTYREESSLRVAESRR